LVKSKIKTKDIIDNIGAGLSLLDRNHRIIWVNKVQSDWFGPLETICNKHCYKIFEHRNSVCSGCPTKKVFKTGKAQSAQKRVAYLRNGEKRYYQLTVSPIKDNNNKVVFALELVQDATKAIIQEQTTRKINKKLKRMCSRVSCVNKRLQKNISRLNNITDNLQDSKNKLWQKYSEKNTQIARVKEELRDIFKVNHTLNSIPDVKKVSSLITRLTCELLHTDACVLSLIDEQTSTLHPKASFGIDETTMKQIPILRLGESISGKSALARKPLAIYDISCDERILKANIWENAGFNSLLCAPVLTKDKTLGIITTFSKDKHIFNEEEIKITRMFASQVAIALKEAKHNDDIHMNYFNTMHALVLAVEARDPYLRGHTDRVTGYALEIAKAMDIKEQQMEILRYASKVHDVGKISIPDSILNKPGPLSPAERSIIQMHPTKGSEMLSPLKFLYPAIPIVRHHHERFDGNGYPDGLNGEKIPLLARILSCADSFDAMTTDRSYRLRKLSIPEAITEIRNNSGTQFDPKIADLFINILSKEKFPEKEFLSTTNIFHQVSI